MPNRVIKKVNAYGDKMKREVYGRDLEFLNRNKDKYDWYKKDDLNNMIAKTNLHPDIPAEFPGVPLEPD